MSDCLLYLDAMLLLLVIVSTITTFTPDETSAIMMRAGGVTVLERLVCVIDEIHGLGFHQMSLEVVQLEGRSGRWPHPTPPCVASVSKHR